MALRCPRCGESIPRGAMSVARDLARCRCGFDGRFSELIGHDERAAPWPGFDDGIDEPFAAWRSRRGDCVTIGALNLAWWALVLAPFTAIGLVAWIAGVAGTISKTTVTRDELLTLATATVILAMIGSTMIFGILGHVQVTMTKTNGTIRTGLGPLGVTRRFSPHDIEGISECECGPLRRRQTQPLGLLLHGPARILFGCSLCARNRHFIRAAMESELGLVRRDSGPSRSR